MLQEVLMEKLSAIFTKLRERYPSFGKRVSEASAVHQWEQTVGPLIARHARAIRVEKGVLWVEVDHAIWRSELHHRKNQILEMLNKATKRVQTQKKPGPPRDAVPLTDILFLDPKQEKKYFGTFSKRLPKV